MACLNLIIIIIIINFNSVTCFQEQSIRKILYVSGPFILFHVAEESEAGIWGTLSLIDLSIVMCGLGRLELGRNPPQC